jgi:hypothetical protein
MNEQQYTIPHSVMAKIAEELGTAIINKISALAQLEQIIASRNDEKSNNPSEVETSRKKASNT